MKKTVLLTTLVVAGTILTANLLNAQDQNKDTKPADQKPQSAPATAVKPAPARDRVDVIAKFLNLTEEQKAKAKPIIDEETKKFEELRNQKDLKPQERAAKMREIRQATYEKMKPILTEEQWKKFYRPLTNQPAAAPSIPAPPQPAQGQKDAGQPAKSK